MDHPALVVGDWNMAFMTFPSYWEFHHPNFSEVHHFSEENVGIPPTSTL